MNFLNFWRVKALEWADGLGLLAVRLWVAQEYMSAGLTKLSGGWQAPDWFVGLSFPVPVNWLPVNTNWVVAGMGEVCLGLALSLGLLSRFAALGLLFITYVAVYSVHFDLGWAGWNQIETDAGQGFKVPLMLAIMLLTIVSQGAGRYSVDAILARVSFFKWNARPA